MILESIYGSIPDNTEKLIHFCSPKAPPKYTEGRGDFLSLATEKAISVLNYNNRNGFFLMIEGSQIDWGGHDMDSDYRITETIDFDNAVNTVLKFAKENKNTLVLITADHETGGYGIIGGNTATNKVETRFLTDDHTATMVPIFAFGPGAEKFIGTYHNNELRDKILSQFEIHF